jgi:hypothetical protein
MEGDDIKKVMKWVGYVYIPIITIFIGVYFLVQYRLHKIESSPLAPLVEAGGNIQLPLTSATSAYF